LIFTHADGGSDEFNAFVEVLAHRLFPDDAFIDLPASHSLFSALYKLEPTPKLKAVSNGARLLLVHSPVDVASKWQLHDWRPNLNAYRLGADLFVYAAGRRDFRNRLDTAYVAAPPRPPTYTFNVARLRFTGDWNPEPFAWTRFSHRLQWQTGYSVETSPVAVRDLMPSTAPFAHLTGTSAYRPDAAEASALRRYVEAGGVLLIDRCGGKSPFDPAAPQGILDSAFAGAARHTLTSEDPLLNARFAGMDELIKVRVQPFVAEMTISAEHAATSLAEPPFIISAGKGHVLYSPLDLTCGILGVRTWGIAGYEPTYAESFVKNLLLWGAEKQPDR
jgi:hypothetical protein